MEWIWSNRRTKNDTAPFALKEKMAKEESSCTLYRHHNLQFTPSSLSELQQHLHRSTSTRPIVVFVHGFDQSIEKAIARSNELAALLDAELWLYTWPSQPKTIPATAAGKKAIRYLTNRSRSRAKRSADSLAAAFHQWQELLPALNGRPFHLMVHSMGNLVLKRAALAHDLPKVFHRIVLHQAEVPSKDSNAWIEKLPVFNEKIVTRFTNDAALNAAKTIKTERLGTTLPKTQAANTRYISFDDFDTEDTHRLWLNARSNEEWKKAFQELFHSS